jgi:hypothetical protein
VDRRGLVAANSELGTAMNPYLLMLSDHYIFEHEDFTTANSDSGDNGGGGCGNALDGHEPAVDDDAENEHGHGRRLGDANTDAWHATIRANAAKAAAAAATPTAEGGGGGDESPRRSLQAVEKYLGLQVSNDYLRCQALGVEATADSTLAIVNQVALFYGQAGVDAGFLYDFSVYVVGQNFFEGGDPWQGRGLVGCVVAVQWWTWCLLLHVSRGCSAHSRFAFGEDLFAAVAAVARRMERIVD